MKVMTLAEFLNQPPGVLFSFWEPCVSRGLHVKGETLDGFDGRLIDFFYQDLLPQSDGGGGPPAFEDVGERWGAFDETQLFAVYEADDIALLSRLLSDVKPPTDAPRE